MIEELEELSHSDLTKKEDINMATVVNESYDAAWLYGFLLQDGFIENENVTDLLYMGHSYIRHLIRTKEFDMEYDDANRNSLSCILGS